MRIIRPGDGSDGHGVGRVGGHDGLCFSVKDDDVAEFGRDGEIPSIRGLADWVSHRVASEERN